MPRLPIVSNRLPDAVHVEHGGATAARALPEEVAALAWRRAAATLILDYDGTLVPIAATPDLASPDDELRALLTALSGRPGLSLHIVSGRSREDLDRWLGALPIGLHGEHGFWSRPVGGAWTPLDAAAAEWKARARQVLGDVAARTAGSFVEEKTASLAWHYRLSDPELARARAVELREALAALVDRCGLELLAGAEVLEIRPRGVHKGRVAGAILAGASESALVIAIGDDRTDEDLFAALPPSAITIHVNGGPSRARYTLPDSAAVRHFLKGFVAS